MFAPIWMTGRSRKAEPRHWSVVVRHVVKIYREVVDNATRNDIATAVAAHHELGRVYDAVAEGLIERIGSEIDQRVDARLGVISRESDSSAKVSQAGRQAGTRRVDRCRSRRWDDRHRRLDR